MDNNYLYVVTYGRLENNEMRTVVVRGQDKVREMAEEFIHIIPDDLDDYRKDIKDWDGQEALVITHQDDDTFYFSVTEGPASDAQFTDQDMDSFHAFTKEFFHED